MKRQPWLVALAVLVAFALNGQAQEARKDSRCDAPQYFGMCDPYVPGTMVSFPPKRPIIVVDTWHDGPAERAGVCPGDMIVAVNGVVAAENTMDRMLHEIVSAKRSPVVLAVKRGDQNLEFRVGRVRESTLAKLSCQKFFSARSIGRHAVEVPASEKRTEFNSYIDFLERLEQREGLTRIEGLDVPAGTPPEQVKRLLRYSSGGPENSREAQQFAPSGGKYSFGFSVLVLKNPTEVLIDRVYPQSPAFRAGLLPGDRVLEIGGREIPASGDVKALILEPDQERSLSLEVDRAGERPTVELRSELIERIVAADSRRDLPLPSRPLHFDPSIYILGIRVLYSPDPREAMVSQVEWPSPAFDAGLHVGDSILAINGVPISGISREELSNLLVPEGALPWALQISRLGKKKTFTVIPVTYRQAEESIGRKPARYQFVPQGCPAS